MATGLSNVRPSIKMKPAPPRRLTDAEIKSLRSRNGMLAGWATLACGMSALYSSLGNLIPESSIDFRGVQNNHRIIPEEFCTYSKHDVVTPENMFELLYVHSRWMQLHTTKLR